MRYYEITDNSDENFKPLVARFENIRTPGGCRGCQRIPKDSSPPELLHVKDIPVPARVVSTTTWGFGVVAVEFLDLLREEARQNLRLGRLADAKGQIIDEFRTFVGVERIILRGNQTSLHRICEVCGALIYTYLPRESPYVTVPQVASGRSIYEIEPTGLLVNEVIRERIGDRWSDLITFYEVPVLTSPLDGLPVDIGLWPTEEQLIGYKPNLSPWMTGSL